MKWSAAILLVASLVFSNTVVSRASQFRMEGYWETKRGRTYEAVGIGVPITDYQDAVDIHVNDGYELFLVDGYDLNGRTYMNFIFRNPTGKSWIARHDLTASGYQREFDKLVSNGNYCLRWVDSYRKGGTIRYASIFTRHNCQNQIAYHGYSAQRHQSKFNELSRNGWDPVNVSVVSINGNLYYTAFYEKQRGSFLLKSYLTRDQFESIDFQQEQAGRKLVYMNSYTHDHGQLPRLVAIWRSNGQNGVYLPNVYGPGMMDQGIEMGKKGYYTQFVTGYGVGTGHRFDSHWIKPTRTSP